jgi:hypothetical protein
MQQEFDSPTPCQFIKEKNMKWLNDAIKDYDNLSDNDKAHVDATLDSLSDPVDNDTCVCGVKDCPDAYAHTTSGF